MHRDEKPGSTILGWEAGVFLLTALLTVAIVDSPKILLQMDHLSPHRAIASLPNFILLRTSHDE